MFTYVWKPATGQCTPRPQGDTQAVLLQTLGDTYKWMLYGDDDTLFFVDTVLDLLQPFDPELPYAISDNIWFEANSALVSRPCLHDTLHRDAHGHAQRMHLIRLCSILSLHL